MPPNPAHAPERSPELASDTGDAVVRTWPVAVGAAALACLAGGLAALASQGFCVDDAYIHLSYARSLMLGEGLSYNPGDWETGASSPLWLLCLLPFALLDDPAPGVQWLGVLLHACAAAVLAATAARLVAMGPGSAGATAGRIRLGAGLAAGGLTAVHPGLLQGAVSGMEVPLTALTLALCLRATTLGRPAAATVFGCLAVWARPEALLLLAPLAVLHARLRRRLACLAPALGAGLGLAVWVGYDLVVSGYPWPNTRYVKAAGDPLAGLAYLGSQVAPHEPWLVGLGGVVLPLLGLRGWRGWRGWRAEGQPTERWGPAADATWLPLLLLAAWAVAVVAVALTRGLNPLVLFFHRRYFIPLAVAPLLALGIAAGHTGLAGLAGLAGLGRPGRAWRMLWLLPVVGVSVFTAIEVQATQRLQEQGIARLHVEPSRMIAAQLPAASAVLVEGAGATRFYAPRSMRVIDMLGLNDGRTAHLPHRQRPCAWLAARPTHLLVPRQLLAHVLPLFRARQLAEFVDPTYAQTRKVVQQHVALFELDGPTALARRLCPKSTADWGLAAPAPDEALGDDEQAGE